MGNGDGIEVTATGEHRKRLVVVLVITGAVLIAEVIGGLIAGSLALLADAGHMLTDSTGLILALIAASLATRAATVRRTFGLQRAEVLAEIDSRLMLVIAVVGALANLAGLLVLRPAQAKSLNMRGAYLEVLGDLLGSLAVIAAAVLILITGWTSFDPIASLVIVVVIIPRAWLLLREVVDVLLEATPHGVDLAEVREHIKEVRGVVDVHDLHAWTITSGVPVLSAHVIVDHACISEGRSGEVLDRLGECLGGHFDVSHCTFQIEPVGHQEHEAAHHA